MNFRSVADLARVIRENAHSIPDDVDLVVGIPRSGLLAANLIALTLNLRLTDLQSFLHNIPLPSPNIRMCRHAGLRLPQEAKHILLVDDSIASGGSIARSRELLHDLPGSRAITTCAVFAAEGSSRLVNLAFEVVPVPRVFEWNVMHRDSLSACCVDIDGVLCVDPTPEQNDDGEAYAEFLLGARALCVPSYRIGHVVTSRLERYRAPTVDWLRRQGVQYQHLHMLDLPDAQTRRRLGAHAVFKAEVYRRAADTVLFIESDRRQSYEIAQMAGKPVLCFSTQEVFKPGLSTALIQQKSWNLAHEVSAKIHRALKRLRRT